MGGWAKGLAASVSTVSNKDIERKFDLHIAFQSEEGEYVDAESVSFASQKIGWQFACGAAIAKENYKSLKVHIDYVNNINTADFDGLFVHREHFGRSYTSSATRSSMSPTRTKKLSLPI